MNRFFFKQKGWDTLDAEDRAWAQKLNTTGITKEFEVVSRANKLPRMVFLLQNYDIPAATIVTEVLAGIQSGNLDKVRKALPNTPADKLAACSLHRRGMADTVPLFFEAAATVKSEDMWEYLEMWQERISTGYKLDANKQHEIMARCNWHERIREALSEGSQHSSSLFRSLVNGALEGTAETLGIILKWSKKFDQSQHTLDSALINACTLGKQEKATLLLDAGANPNLGFGKALLAAAQHNHYPLVDLLTQRGADLPAYLEDITYKLGGNDGAPSRMVRYLRERAEAMKKPVGNKENRFFLAAPHTLGEVLALPEGGQLTVLFNFSSRQQIFMAQDKTLPHQPLALHVRNFGDIENPAILDKAAQKLRELGGDPSLVSDTGIRFHPKKK